jgi:hypothetical protein
MTHRYARTLLAAFAFAGLVACDSDEETEVRYTATLNGANERPTPRVTSATGSATITEDDGALDYVLNVSNMTAVTLAHIHLGNAETAGGVIVPLYLGPTLATINGTLATGTITQSTITMANVTMDSLRTLLRNGNAYVNVHSTTFPGGEIRGQVVRQN